MKQDKKLGKSRLDKYYKLSKKLGYRARSAFKLIQLNNKYKFLNDAMVIIDLCAAPGGWLQVSKKYASPKSIIIGVDLVPIKPIEGVVTFVEDITTEKCKNLIKNQLSNWKADVVLHDGAPNVGSNWSSDAFNQSKLVIMAFKIACSFLKKGGTFVTKVFRSKDFNSILWALSKFFETVNTTKPDSSREISAEIFIVCQNYKAPKKIDPRFFDINSIFSEIIEEEPVRNIFKESKKLKKAQGYSDNSGVLINIGSLKDFIFTNDPIKWLGKYEKINNDFDIDFINDKKLEEIFKNDIKELFNDLQLISKKELKSLLKWRKEIRKKIEIQKYKLKDLDYENEDQKNLNLDLSEKNDDIDLKIENIDKEIIKIQKKELKKKAKDKIKSKKKHEIITKLEEEIFTIKDLDQKKLKKKEDDEIISNDKTKKENIQDLNEFENDNQIEHFYDPHELDNEFNSNSSNQTIPDSQFNTKNIINSNNNLSNDEIVLKSNEKSKVFFSNDLFKEVNDEISQIFKQKKSIIQNEDPKNIINSNNNLSNDEIVLKSNEKSKVFFSNNLFKEVHNETSQIFKRNNEKKEEDINDNKLTTIQKKSKIQKEDLFSNPEAVSIALKLFKDKQFNDSETNESDDEGDYLSKWDFEDRDLAPSWFYDDEMKNMRKKIQITKEASKICSLKKPIIQKNISKKELEAKFRQKNRANRRAKIIESKASKILENPEIPENLKHDQIQKLYRNVSLEKKKKSKLIVSKKSMPIKGRIKKKRGIKFVDRRLKKDLRASKLRAKSKSRKR